MVYNFKYFFYCIIFLNVIYSCGGKAEFSAAISPVFSLADLVLKKHFLLLSQFYFLINRKFKRAAYSIF